MSENFEQRIRDIESRKRNLEEQINQRQEEISRRAASLKDEIEDRLRPEEIIRKHPVVAMGVSFGAGFLLARLITGGSHSPAAPAPRSAPSAQPSGNRVSGLVSDMAYDFLKAAKDMALGYAVDYASQVVQSKLENKKPKS